MNHPIPVFLAFNDTYTQHAAVTIVSALKNSSAPFAFYILHQDISNASQDKIRSLKNTTRPFNVEFIKINPSDFEDIAIKSDHISLETTFRFIIPEMAPDLDKAIYLDSDLIVRADLAKLWATPLGTTYAGVVEDFASNNTPERKALLPSSHYFNAGVLLLNLARIRENFSLNSFLETERQNRHLLRYQDQDVLNIMFADNVRYLSLHWNATSPLFRKIPRTPFRTKAEIINAQENPAIVHFTGPDKPWVIPDGIISHPFVDEYFMHLQTTPFARQRNAIFQNYPRQKRFFWYWKRHPVFFLRPSFWRMRLLKRKTTRNIHRLS